MRIERFEARVRQTQLDDLLARLERTRWPRELVPLGDDPGVDPAELRELIEYWSSGFDWRAAEERLNRFPQFRADLAGCRVHFIHARGRGPRPLPLILTHGWPGPCSRCWS